MSVPAIPATGGLARDYSLQLKVCSVHLWSPSSDTWIRNIQDIPGSMPGIGPKWFLSTLVHTWRGKRGKRRKRKRKRKWKRKL